MVKVYKTMMEEFDEADAYKCALEDWEVARVNVASDLISLTQPVYHLKHIP